MVTIVKVHQDSLTYDDPTAHQGLQRGGLPQDDEGEHHVKNRGQWTPHGVESHSDILQAEVVEGDHADKHHGQRQDLPGRLQVETDRGEVDDPRAKPGEQLHDPAESDRHRALVESDEQRRVQLSVVQKVIIKEHHGDGDKPVECDHSSDPDCSEYKGLSISVRGRCFRACESHLQYAGPLQLEPDHVDTKRNLFKKINKSEYFT